MTKLQTWIAGVGGLIVVLTAMVMFVPDYFDARAVDATRAEIARMAAEQGTPQEIVALEKKYIEIIGKLDAIVNDVGEVKTAQTRLERKQDSLNEVFRDYLIRQAQ